MGILRSSHTTLRSLAYKEKHHGSRQVRRMFAQLSQAMLKVGQQPTVGLPRQVSKDPVISWLFPATLALLGLSFSTFCTHQLVATSDSRSLALSASETKENRFNSTDASTKSNDGSSSSSRQ